jgi:hypothetical protein
VAGRSSSSLATDIAKVNTPFKLSRAGTLTVAATSQKVYNNSNVPLKIRGVKASVGTAPTGAALRVDVLINGTSIYAAAGDRVSIAISGLTNVAPNGVPTKTGDAIVVLPGQYVTAEVTVIGSSVAGADLSVEVLIG